MLYRNNGVLAGMRDLPLDIQYRGQLEIWTGEIQQLAQFDRHTLVAGTRIQDGDFMTRDLLTGDTRLSPRFGDTTGQGVFHKAAILEDFRRISFYAYETWHLMDQLALTAGLAWKDLRYPANFRNPLLDAGTEHTSRLLPKAALVWSPVNALTIRGMYGQLLGGVSLDESYRLEPVQLAGFSQAFRTVIPESIVGSISAHQLDLGGTAVDVKLPSRTYLGFLGTVTDFDVD
ncbi:MAG: hypothetical protein EXS36_09035 [Pedosphaera sp.]|nr:hypothetical protein [Pedosphaera sp.]